MKTTTEQVYEIAFDLLDKNKDGLRWTDLIRLIKEAEPSFHPKTVNGLVWKFVERYPDKVYRTDDKLFRLVKFRDDL
jgi:Ca2+-binding EF-hand superfamily protein